MLFSLLAVTSVQSQNLPFQWQRSFGGLDYEWLDDLHQCPDGGYIVFGNTKSSDFYINDNHGGYDWYAVKLNAAGNVEWKKCYGGTNFDFSISVACLSDGGFAFCGYTASTDGNVSGNNGAQDAWICCYGKLQTNEFQQDYFSEPC